MRVYCRDLNHFPYEPCSKLLLKGLYRDFIGSLLKGY